VRVEVEVEKYTNPILYSKNYFLFSFHKRWEDSWAWVEFVSKYWERDIFFILLAIQIFLRRVKMILYLGIEILYGRKLHRS
jgi:hypothetical protein